MVFSEQWRKAEGRTHSSLGLKGVGVNTLRVVEIHVVVEWCTATTTQRNTNQCTATTTQRNTNQTISLRTNLSAHMSLISQSAWMHDAKLYRHKEVNTCKHTHTHPHTHPHTHTAETETNCTRNLQVSHESPAKTLVTCYILSRLDCCNCLLMGTPNSNIHLSRKFQSLLQDSISWYLATTTQNLSWKHCTGFRLQKVLSIKLLVFVSVL